MFRRESACHLPLLHSQSKKHLSLSFNQSYLGVFKQLKVILGTTLVQTMSFIENAHSMNHSSKNSKRWCFYLQKVVKHNRRVFAQVRAFVKNHSDRAAICTGIWTPLYDLKIATWWLYCKFFYDNMKSFIKLILILYTEIHKSHPLLLYFNMTCSFSNGGSTEVHKM